MRLLSWGRLLIMVSLMGLTACLHPTQTEPTPPPAPLDPAVRMLVERAEQYLDVGNIMMAESQAERAYRMQPSDYRVLLLQARVAAAQEAPADAEQWALRALEKIHSGHLSEQALIWEHIAVYRREQGDYKGAQAARDEAKQLRKVLP